MEDVEHVVDVIAHKLSAELEQSWAIHGDPAGVVENNLAIKMMSTMMSWTFTYNVYIYIHTDYTANTCIYIYIHTYIYIYTISFFY